MSRFRNCLTKLSQQTPPVGGLRQFDQFLFHSPRFPKRSQLGLEKELTPANPKFEKSLGCSCVALRYRRTLILGVTKSPTACPSPACSGDITRTRTVPTRGRFVFRYRLYSCNTCHKTIQTEETVKSADYPKRYVSRIEVHDRKPNRHDVEDDEDLGLNSW